MSLRSKSLLFIVLFLVFVVIIYLNASLLSRLLYPIYYKQEILNSAKKFSVEPHLIAAIIRVESNYNPLSVSPKGARGIMQLMPDTASWVIEKGFKQKFTLEEMNNVQTNIDIGTWYLRWLDTYYQGNFFVAIAAYNAGPGNVDQWLEKGIWNGTQESIELIPYPETRKYVTKVLYYYTKYQKLYE